MIKIILAILLIFIALVVLAYRGFTWRGRIVKLIFRKETKLLTKAKLDYLLNRKVAHIHKNPVQKVKE